MELEKKLQSEKMKIVKKLNGDVYKTEEVRALEEKAKRVDVLVVEVDSLKKEREKIGTLEQEISKLVTKKHKGKIVNF